MTVKQSVQKVIEILEKHCFEVTQKGNIYHCNRPKCCEIKFRETIGGDQIFHVGKTWCHTVYKALEMAVIA
jgi:hypothetical protein